MGEFIPFGSSAFYLIFILLIIARGMDFLSTWIATPNLVLEANPIARKIGWKIGIILNLVLCFAFSIWPLPAVVIITSSLLVAARNFQSAWLMRTLGEEPYRTWICDRIRETSVGLYLLCLLAQTALIASLGAALMVFSDLYLVPFAIGMGMITYAVTVVAYTLLSVWRIRRSPG